MRFRTRAVPILPIVSSLVLLCWVWAGELLASPIEHVTPGTGWVLLIDATSGEPIAGAEVVFRVASGSGDWSSWGSSTPRIPPDEAESDSIRRSDSEGLVRVPSDGAARHGQVEVEGYGPAWFVSSVAGPSPSRATRIALGRAASLVLVTVDGDGLPVSGVNLQLSASFYYLVKRRYGFVSGPKFGRSVVSDKDGRCHLDDLPCDVPFELTLRAPGGPSRRDNRPLVLAAGEERKERRVIGSGTRITGRLLDEEGLAVTKRHVILKVAWATRDTVLHHDNRIAGRTLTDEGGGFVFEEVPDGEWWVAAEPLDGPTLAKWVDLVAGEEARDVELVIWTGSTSIAGHVCLALTGKRSPAWISLIAISGQAAGRVFHERTEPDGQFVIGPLPPGTYELSAGDADVSAHTDGKLVVQAGDSGVAVELFPMGRISGQVVDAAGAQVVVESVGVFGSERTGLVQGASSGSATFDLASLPPDTYCLVAVARDGRVALAHGVELARGQVIEDLELEVQIGAFLFLRWQGASRTANYSIYLDDQLVASDGLPRGTEVVEVLPPGRVRVVMDRLGTQRSEHEVVLEPGQDQHLTFPR